MVAGKGDRQLQEDTSTDAKRAYLRRWAQERASGDPGRLPVIREARAAVREHFGEGPGAGLGTDLIAQTLRDLRDELRRARRPAAPPDQVEQLARIAHITALMREEGVRELEIGEDGVLLGLRRFSR